jgi:hypothetical protein
MTARKHPDRPRARATEALTDGEAASLYAFAERVGGWNALHRAWPELAPTTLRRAARGECVTPLVLSAVRTHLRPGPVATRPRPSDARKGHG